MSTLHPKRRINRDHLKAVRALPCIACEIAGVQQTSPSEAHHIRRMADGQPYGTSQKAHDDETIPLCYFHHWNGVGSTYTHRGFEAEFGNERELLVMTKKLLKNAEPA